MRSWTEIRRSNILAMVPPLKGAERIAAYLKTLPDQPGVYRMLNAAGDVLYVGKAKSLKKRRQSYALRGGHTDRLTRMMAETAEMLFVTTASRDRGAAAGIQSDQAAQAPLQCFLSRRQKLSQHPAARGSSLSRSC